MLDVKYQLKRVARRTLAPLLYRYPPFALAPERLYLFLHHLIETRNIPGAVVEIGCNLGGTAIIARRMMDRLGVDKPYICIDTFDGFVDSQFDADATRGTPKQDRTLFSGNSRFLVSKIMGQHDCNHIRLVQGDITTLPERSLPEACSVVLVDVDLVEPTHVALKRFWPRMRPGGIILVDDCAEQSSWKARVGYDRFCKSHDIMPRYLHGMGLLAR